MTRYNPRLERSLKRRSSYRDIKQSFLIICEGVNTEPDYFNAFRLTSASVKAGKRTEYYQVGSRSYNHQK